MNYTMTHSPGKFVVAWAPVESNRYNNGEKVFPYSVDRKPRINLRPLVRFFLRTAGVAVFIPAVVFFIGSLHNGQAVDSPTSIFLLLLGVVVAGGSSLASFASILQDPETIRFSSWREASMAAAAFVEEMKTADGYCNLLAEGS